MALLLQGGGYLLQEGGGKILLEGEEAGPTDFGGDYSSARRRTNRASTKARRSYASARPRKNRGSVP